MISVKPWVTVVSSVPNLVSKVPNLVPSEPTVSLISASSWVCCCWVSRISTAGWVKVLATGGTRPDGPPDLRQLVITILYPSVLFKRAGNREEAPWLQNR
jgi:hypothetical protein